MECRELKELITDRLVGADPEPLRAEAEAHLDECAACRAERSQIEEAWALLAEDRDAALTPAFRARSLALLEDEMIRQRVRAFRPRSAWPRRLAYAAGWILAAAAGYWAARQIPTPGRTALLGPTAAPAPPSKAAQPEGSLSNVSYRAADSSGRISVTFDVTSRQTVVGKPEDPAMARLLAYLVSRGAQTSGERSRAIELVSSQYGTRVAPASAEIVAALTATLKKDENPGVRKKAAAALAGFRMTPEIRTAFLDALRSDRNPAVRLVAVEALASAAREAPDARTIESLREKAVDPSENGFVRAKAASALKSMEF